MAQVSRATHASSVSTKLADNTAGDISAQDIREVITDLEDSVTWYDEAEIVYDTTPQLGGNLDVNGSKIVSVSNGNIDIEPNGTGNVLLGNFVIDADATIGAGQDNYVLVYDHSSGTWRPEVNAPTGYQLQPSEGAFVDGDKTKLDGIETGADVTDTANVTAAGALMDSELTDLAGVKALDTSTLALLSANTFTGTQDFNGQQVEGALNKVVTSVTGTLTAADHSGNILKTSGNVTVPTTAGFTCILIAGGAHTVTFNATTSAAMATGDLMTIAVESSTVIHAVLTAAADKVSFT